MSQKVYLTIDELKDVAAYMGYELRKKGVKREKHNETDADGNPIRNCYAPHIALTASGLARTWKVLKKARAVFGYEEGSAAGVVWEGVLLLALEHVIRWLEHDLGDKAMLDAIQRLVRPLPKSEYIRNRKNKENR